MNIASLNSPPSYLEDIERMVPLRRKLYHTTVARLGVVIRPLRWQIDAQASIFSQSANNARVAHSTSALAVRGSWYGLTVLQLAIVPRSVPFPFLQPGHLQRTQCLQVSSESELIIPFT